MDLFDISYMPWPIGRPAHNKGRARTKEERAKMSLGRLKQSGGRTITTGGYLYIFKPDHPHATRSGYIMEHRLIMEEYIGRVLDYDEDVHHINGLKTDNRLANLQLLTHAKHASFSNLGRPKIKRLALEYYK